MVGLELPRIILYGARGISSNENFLLAVMTFHCSFMFYSILISTERKFPHWQERKKEKFAVTVSEARER
jgi:hypothetical protein